MPAAEGVLLSPGVIRARPCGKRRNTGDARAHVALSAERVARHRRGAHQLAAVGVENAPGAIKVLARLKALARPGPVAPAWGQLQAQRAQAQGVVVRDDAQVLEEIGRASCRERV